MKLSTFTLAIFSCSTCALHLGREEYNDALTNPKRNTGNTLLDTTVNSASTAIPSVRPVDPRLQSLRDSLRPWWLLPNTEGGEMNALTGQQLNPFDDDVDYGKDSSGSLAGYSPTDDVDDDVCPISHCGRGLFSSDCGTHARCINGYCQCDLGWKPMGHVSSGDGMARGWTGLESLTVWSGAATGGCPVLCDTLSCSEVPQFVGCFDGKVQHNEGSNQDSEDKEELETDGLSLGAIKAPGADAGLPPVADGAAGGTGQAS